MERTVFLLARIDNEENWPNVTQYFLGDILNRPESKFISKVILNIFNEINAYSYKDPKVLNYHERIEKNEYENPYKGLNYFGPKDAGLFFGRGRLIQKLCERLEQNQCLVLTGPSGAGKSSVTLAGVAPELNTKRNWKFAYFRITDSLDHDPFLSLAQAINPLIDNKYDVQVLAKILKMEEVNLLEMIQSNDHSRVLLIVDQFEELFAENITEYTRAKFIRVLTSLAQDLPNNLLNEYDNRPRLMLTIRTDFLDTALKYEQFNTAFGGRQEHVGPMSEAELREAIESPALLHNIRFEKGLVDTIIGDLRISPGQLPLVEFALEQMWPLCVKKGFITHEAYNEVGKVQGAIKLHAEEVFKQLTDGNNAYTENQFRHVFCNLAYTQYERKITRRVALGSDFNDDEWDLVQKLAGEKQRLIVIKGEFGGRDKQTVEVIHEELLAQWSRFSEWIESEHTFLTWRSRLRGHMAHEGVKLTGIALDIAKEFLETRGGNFTEEERIYIKAAIEEQEQNIKNSKRTIRIISTSIVVIIAIMIIVALIGFVVVMIFLDS